MQDTETIKYLVHVLFTIEKFLKNSSNSAALSSKVFLNGTQKILIYQIQIWY